MDTNHMMSSKDIAARMAHLSGNLSAGGRSQQMLGWWREYKKLWEQFKVAKKAEEAQTKATEVGAATATEEGTEGSQATSGSLVPGGTTAGQSHDAAHSDSAGAEDPETTAETPRTRARRKVTFREPEPEPEPEHSDHVGHGDHSDFSDHSDDSNYSDYSDHSDRNNKRGESTTGLAHVPRDGYGSEYVVDSPYSRWEGEEE